MGTPSCIHKCEHALSHPMHRYREGPPHASHRHLHPVGTNPSTQGIRKPRMGLCLAQSLAHAIQRPHSFEGSRKALSFHMFFFPPTLLVCGGQLPARPPPASEAPWPPSPAGAPAQPAPRPGAAWAFPEWRGLLQALECDRAPAHLTQVSEPPADGALAVGGL